MLYWVRSWYLPEEGKFYCEWDAKDPDAIREVIAAAGLAVPQPPIEGIYAVAASVSGEDSQVARRTRCLRWTLRSVIDRGRKREEYSTAGVA